MSKLPRHDKVESISRLANITAKKKIFVLVVLLSFTLLFSVFSLAKTSLNVSGSNVIIGQAQTLREGLWDFSFWYFDGQKAISAEPQAGACSISVSADISKGAVDLSIEQSNTQLRGIKLTDLQGTSQVDIAQTGGNCQQPLTLRVSAQKARGSVRISWLGKASNKQ